MNIDTNSGIESKITNTLKPEDAIKITKDELLPLIFNKLYWCSWTWIDHGSYYGISTSPWSYLDGISLCINYKRNIFQNDLLIQTTDYISTILFEKAKQDIINKILVEDYYYYVLNNEGGLDIFTENLTGRKIMFENLYPD